jgi:hypothetical protein
MKNYYIKANVEVVIDDFYYNEAIQFYSQKEEVNNAN